MGAYFDRYVRDEAHLWDVMRYMEENPVKAGLVRLQGSGLGWQAVCRNKTHPGARASRPHRTWHHGNEPCNGGFGAPCKGVALDGRLLAGIRLRAGRPRSRVVPTFKLDRVGGTLCGHRFPSRMWLTPWIRAT